MNAPATITPRNWHDMLELARADRKTAPRWIGMIREQAAADKNERELVDACQLYLDVYGEQDDEADALCEIAECLDDSDDGDGFSAERWADEADYRYDLMREAEMVAQWEGR